MGYRSLDIKELASKIGLDVPDMSDESLLLTYIAEQIGLPDYFNTPADQERLYSALSDLKYRQNMDAFMGKDDVSIENVELTDEILDAEESQMQQNVNDDSEDKNTEPEEDDKKENENQGDTEDKEKKNETDTKDNETNNTSDRDKSSSKDNQNINQQSGLENKNSGNKQLSLPDKQIENNNGYKSNLPSVQTSNSDITNNAYRNLRHNQQIQEGKKNSLTESNRAENKNNLPKKDDNSLKQNKTTNSPKKGSGALNKAKNVKNTLSNPKGALKNVLKRKITSLILTHPYIFIIVIIVFVFCLVLFICLSDVATNSSSGNGNGKGGKNCTYHLSGVTSTGTIDLENVKVELINCEGTSSAYKVLETVDFEKYVIGVALGEVGNGANDEVFKTQIIAARNFALTRNSSMCPGNPDNCFYGYNPNTNTIRMRACEADQVYVDMNRDTYIETTGSNIHRFTPEANGGSLYKAKLSDSEKQRIEALGEEVRGKVLQDKNGNVIHTGYINTDQNAWMELASQGLKYDQILDRHYGGGKISNATCTTYVSDIDYGDYVLDSSNDVILHQSLDSFLESKGTSLEKFNSLIASNVEKNGYGTRAGVVAAAVTLIAELGNNYGVKVPYFWGGGHYDGIVDGTLGYWGSTQCYIYANNQPYNYCGLDCSGFVMWAIKNGGVAISPPPSGDFENLDGAKRVSLSSNSAVLEPGDLLESSGHVVLVVGIDEDNKQYICAEASGNQEGVWFTRRGFTSSEYWGVQMEGYYSTHAR